VRRPEYSGETSVMHNNQRFSWEFSVSHRKRRQAARCAHAVRVQVRWRLKGGHLVRLVRMSAVVCPHQSVPVAQHHTGHIVDVLHEVRPQPLYTSPERSAQGGVRNTHIIPIRTSSN